MRRKGMPPTLFLCLFAILTFGLEKLPARADEPAVPKYGWREVWTGADAMRGVWLIYTGVTLAPWNEHVYEPGWRLRAQSGYGQYDYALGNGEERRIYRGSVTYADAMAGYHWQAGNLTAKFYAGLSYIEHDALPGASKGHLVGSDWGPKVATELWLNIGQAQWTSLNANFTTAHNTASLRWRYGVMPAEGWSVGPELRLDTNAGLYEHFSDMFAEYEARAGAFATYKWDGYEVTLAGGFAAYVKGTDLSEQTPYATINFLVQF